MGWEQGRSVVEGMVRSAMLERVPPDLGGARSLLAAYQRVRRTRNAGDYGGQFHAVADDVLADHLASRLIVDIASRVIGQMSRF